MNKENIIMEQKKDIFHLKKDNSLFGYIHLINKDYKFNNYSNNMIKELPQYTIQLENDKKQLINKNKLLEKSNNNIKMIWK